MSENRLEYRGKMILAPMVKIGTTPTRLLALDYGADIVYTEEIIDWRLLKSKRIENPILKTVDYVDKSDDTLLLRISERERGHLVLQIGTCDPDRAVAVAKMVQNDVDAIDVNMGCPKSFSLKGGMGAALLSHPEKIRKILTSLVAAVNIPVTCKIRILPKLEDTLNLVKMIETTGVTAIGVHGRTKEERPSNPNHDDFIHAVVKHVNIPVIANGGSSNNRDSSQNTFEGIMSFWRNTTADSVMIARAAEWNTSVFRKEGKEDVYTVINKYLDHAIELDYTFVVVKYNIQQILGSEQDTVAGKAFLSSCTMRELCAIFGKEDQFIERQAFIREKMQQLSMTDYHSSDRVMRNRRESTSSEFQTATSSKRRKLFELDVETFASEDVEVTEMALPFVRGHYSVKDSGEIPKAKLHSWVLKNAKQPPVYITWQRDKMFRSVVTVESQKFSSAVWEKNKRYSEQAAALVALHCLGIHEFRPGQTIIENKAIKNVT